MNCCDSNTQCHGGQDCPARPQVVRRYRAGEPAQQPLPPLPIDFVGADRVTTLDIVMAGACIVLCVFILAVTLNTLGWL